MAVNLDVLFSCYAATLFFSVTQVQYVCQFDDNSGRQMISNFSLKKNDGYEYDS